MGLVDSVLEDPAEWGHLPKLDLGGGFGEGLRVFETALVVYSDEPKPSKILVAGTYMRMLFFGESVNGDDYINSVMSVTPEQLNAYDTIGE